ncbi:hypothetical protein BVRB_9g223190 [Beta vulgaris subsp. vulgaris]|nr:hypothetical protein BVRB_9g223190 [Beta vulgaris subsp. vulgaris]
MLASFTHNFEVWEDHYAVELVISAPLTSRRKRYQKKHYFLTNKEHPHGIWMVVFY